ncbi:MAG: DUF2752 domain-containing protein [Chloroherpetonaceae bacterium]|nr:DUF2752 domain-containing protein [Chloroherpetonaceae bacterium]MDW8019382.1 DUF2752 domain-containing protein [Chloroherpetonaceae bacterium]
MRAQLAESTLSSPSTLYEGVRVVNWVLLLLCVYGLCFPRLSPQLAKVFPALSTCWYQARTGKPCPFCGITRDWQQLTAGNFMRAKRLNAMSLPLFLLCIVEIVWRTALLAGLMRTLCLKRWITLDLLVHAALLAWTGFSLLCNVFLTPN